LKRRLKYFIGLMTACLFLKAGIGFSQDQKYIDSLVSVLPSIKEDSNKVLLLGDISFYYANINPQEGIKYGEEAIKLSKKIKYSRGIAIANRFVGINYAAQSYFPQALEYYFIAAKEFEKLNDIAGAAKVNLSIGLIYTNQEDYPRAFQYLQMALDGFKQIGNKNAESKVLNNIGNLFAKNEEHQWAIKYYSLALNINTELGDSNAMESSISNMGAMYFELGNFDKSFENFFRALNINQATGNKLFRATHLGGLGNNYLSIARDTNGVWLKKYFNGNKIAALHEAQKYLDSSLVLYNELGNLSDAFEYYKYLSETQELLGDINGALVSYKNFVAARDSVHNEENVKRTLEMQLQFDYEKKEAIAREELRRHKLVRNGFIGGFGIMLVFAIIFLYQRNRIKKGKKESDALLLNILPYEVAEELKQKGTSEAQFYDEVSILFTDFKGFTQLSEKMLPRELVAEIDYCFRKFDEIITRHGIEKIKTIGDAYMAVSGLPMKDPQHAKKMVTAALEIREFMQVYKNERIKQNKLFFEIRIGIHTGEVVAGIVGVKKFAYDIWGDAVNMASRMESSGEIGKVNISESTYSKVQHDFNCEYRGEVEAKGKGKVKMFFAENKG
jgi:adenylate cyclase